VDAYVDSSVLLRVVFGERGRLAQWAEIQRPVASELIRVECLRTLDRARIAERLADGDVARVREDLLAVLDSIALVRLDAAVLARAAEPFPTLVGTLDAIHLASALLAREVSGDLRLATHDRELEIAARALGFMVLT
jgi:predicted nucleic acid-binding protein